MKRYNPKDIESKWQKTWDETGIYRTDDSSNKPKRYVLEYFPYPSGAAMHVGHVRNYTIGDAISRHARMSGYNVLHPMGWDAFGLPAENYAIKTGISPRQAIDENTARFKKQLIQMGFGYDWSREIDSTDPKYYRWTQWLFLLLYKRGLAYQKESLQWWCPHDKTVLANEQVEAGKCWRCGHLVEKKSLDQWFFKITDYADRLLNDLDDLNWSHAIKTMQRNWIGKSKGAEIEFHLENTKDTLRVFTTRPDTVFGATFMILAPEHPLVEKITATEQKGVVGKYIQQTQAKSDIERQEQTKEKTGVFTGASAINPATKEKIPIWIADYVLYSYGTGAIMAVPAHDERDFAFAKQFSLPIVRVINNEASDDACTTSEGTMINSGTYSGLPSDQAREAITKDLTKAGCAEEKTNYKIRDWLISRQRYWGAPIPVIHCEKDGIVPVPDDQLPVVLPELDSYEPTGEGSVLDSAQDWVNVDCPVCGRPAKRETDTMDGFACSSWYFLRFADPHNDKAAFDKKQADQWLPVDDYIGGAEHAVMHLLYARFWTKVMHDAGLINFQEPFTTLRNQGMILAPDGLKMSKSKGNTIEPDEIIFQGYGADAIRIMELFIGPWNQSASWSVEGMGGCFRFLQRIWTITQEHIEARGQSNVEPEGDDLLRLTHQAIKKVSQDMQELGFNTAIAALMEFVNDLYKQKAKDPLGAQAWDVTLVTLLKLVAPFAPHIAEELWSDIGQEGSIHVSEWPAHDEKYLVSDTMTIVVQVNGKVRANISVSTDADEEAIVDAAKADTKVQPHIQKEVRKTIYVPRKLVNFVV